MENHKSITTMPTIEVFKTDVTLQEDADKLVKVINTTFTSYQANFDLEDCDNILRVKSTTDNIATNELIKLLHNLGFSAVVL